MTNVDGLMKELGAEKLKEMLSTMHRIRCFEEESQRQFTKGKISGMFHSCMGEEAIYTGVCETLAEDDYIVTTHRNHGALIARGAAPKYMMAELFGKKTGYNKGKAGDMHVNPHELGLVCSTAIVGAGIPISLGPALASKMKHTNQVTVCFFGDGATNTGYFHESLNLASVYLLPVIFVIVNSQFAFSTHISKTTKLKELSRRAVSYDIPGVTSDGNKLLDVFETVREVVKCAREGKGPALINFVSYNRQNPKKYNMEVEGWEKTFGDPIDRFEKICLEKNILSSAQIETIRKNALEEMTQASNFADESPWPDLQEALSDVFV